MNVNLVAEAVQMIAEIVMAISSHVAKVADVLIVVKPLLQRNGKIRRTQIVPKSQHVANVMIARFDLNEQNEQNVQQLRVTVVA